MANLLWLQGGARTGDAGQPEQCAWRTADLVPPGAFASRRHP